MRARLTLIGSNWLAVELEGGKQEDRSIVATAVSAASDAAGPPAQGEQSASEPETGTEEHKVHSLVSHPQLPEPADDLVVEWKANRLDSRHVPISMQGKTHRQVLR